MMRSALIFAAVALVCMSGLVASEEGLRLIALTSETDRQWMTVQQVEELILAKRKFIDITETPVPVRTLKVPPPIPDQPFHKDYVDVVIQDLSSNQIAQTITQLSSYFTRYYTSATGKAAAEYIHGLFTELAGEREDITVDYFEHSWIQPSVIARIKGQGPNADEVVIIGAHEDSVGVATNARAPGADDDASGTATIIEAFRVLVENGYTPDRTVEFHTYAGEEAGLRGSQDIATAYAQKQVDVMTMMQFDMTGYVGRSGAIGIITDFTNVNLTAFMRILVDTYTELNWQDSTCGYGCSDHASWTRNGYRSAFPFEAPFGQHSPFIHSANDLLQSLDLNHAREFAKLAVGYVVELGGVGGMM
eukprot:TRINITY_DN5323_c0_g1_i1.p1 TRINITY_DN5323_c0_g1~~TRINITY_DN5323_c0_g1_i1.p1  ORF type:complete len:362 (-),score=62.88 TRINITY_DN5323_c0_g1_i1:75-1160(-)